MVSFGKEARIMTLLVIDVAFFLLEIIVGYAVGSLALVADSFHMLNDVMSLIVALYAVKLVKQGNETRDPRYSYGWQRAEILGALINGVFLLALCFSIFMEAIERFVNVTEVQNPKLVVVVGTLGLASNIVGLFLFHDHGHSHGGSSHSHDHEHSHAHGQDAHDHSAHDHAGENDATAKRIAHARERSESVNSLFGHPAATRAYVVRTAHDLGYEAAGPSQHTEDGHGSPERQRLLSKSKGDGYGATQSHARHSHDESHGDSDLESADATGQRGRMSGFFSRFSRGKSSDGKGVHGHDHTGGHGHSHAHSHGHGHGGEGSMNMQGVFLHVLGDALGNVGVIASGLFIAFSTVSWRYYTDPAISFLITIIIFHSALPLVKSASFILLQGVPNAVPLDQVHQSLLEVKGVLSVHELHIWQLSESKNVASVHVLIDVDEADLTKAVQPGDETAGQQMQHGKANGNSNESGNPSGVATPVAGAAARTTLIPQEHRYMDIATQIRRKLHQFNIHSSTIQPEFVRGGIRGVARAHGVEIDENVTNAIGKLVSTQGELVERQLSRNGSMACLIACGPDGETSCVESACCPPPALTAQTQHGKETNGASATTSGVDANNAGAANSSASS